MKREEFNGVTSFVKGDAKAMCPASHTVRDRWGTPIRVPCGRCERCLKFKTTVMTGRLMAEAIAAGSVWFVTLTYAPEFYDGSRFVYKHVQDFMKRMRYHHPGVRFFAVGEKGEIGGRRHWHVLLFFPEYVPFPKDGPEGVYPREVWSKQYKWGRERGIASQHWDRWGMGRVELSEVKVHSPDDFVAQIRYVAMYLYKKQRSGADEYDTVRARWSCKPILGYQFIMGQACKYAALPDKALPLHFSFKEVRVCKGGNLWKFPILGSFRAFYFRAYIAESLRLRPTEQVKGGAEMKEALRLWHIIGQEKERKLRDARAMDKLMRNILQDLPTRQERQDLIDAIHNQNVILAWRTEFGEPYKRVCESQQRDGRNSLGRDVAGGTGGQQAGV